MITQIYLEDFKCFRTVNIYPKRVTCFVGANGTGKSSVLQAFGLLKQSIESVQNFGDASSRVTGSQLKLDGPLSQNFPTSVPCPGTSATISLKYTLLVRN